ncbi:MAG: hypothetical protein ACPG4T_20425 [Nannocystaceae bacterium]
MSSKRHSPPDRLRDGLPYHGSSVDEGVVLRARSKGPGAPVEVQSPLGGPPRRVVSGPGTVRWAGGKLSVIPTSAAAGEEFAIVVEP